MELIFNDLSIHEQFSDMAIFRDAIKRVMTIRQIAYQFDRELYSWKDLETVARRRYPNLTFSADSFEPLNGHPFGKSAAEYLLLRLNILHTFKNCCDPQGKRTPEGNEIHENYFKGENAWFSDSSDTEKDEFEAALTFPHPETPRAFLFCPWHGKANYTPPLRIHFSWPIQMNKPLYVVYVGPKITRR